ncbi:NACHT, LRR and PYD domains-containing protein 3-like [Mercenaria mercenaria]|uniref:NACHT, LRR and PYD domains-containing protein 3-like n=1 Tax=Mercenaria mercenaria TaxID=6596 RepID=UPI00234E7F3F|nr:NACHT, LRR and PYD domains-containing protein 3-like [Mercenaria mercenaria]XP_053382081.1 NACHT, LRR and PYD domains-containing protein 3-like [Mercenaria mercenaria]XP_053382082.1 NACHT, LRR and PYD domains-containing protein 3-like [Mercenaria mercenaria]XP_053382083.1 NACHT, LRR and PYD domains-containing protein 3-like [Mercenaria mercenaria]
MSPLMEEKDTPLLKFYVMPDIESVEIQRARGGGKEIRSKVTSLHDVFYKEKEPCHKIYLTADAGFGKTALSKRLVLTWCQAKNCIPNEDEHFKKEDISTMSDFDFVFLLSLRDCSEEWDIDEMIKKQIINYLAHTISTSDFENILSKERCLIILDGLDEFTHAKSDIPHRKARRKCTILTTTRPWKLGVSKISASEIERKLELIGLSKTSSKSLKRTVISLLCGKTDIEKHIQEFDRAISDRGISDLETIPLLLMYLCVLWCDGIELGASRTELYCQTVELLLKRTFEKYPDMQQPREQSQSDIPQCFSEHEHCKEHYTFLQALGQLAFETLFSENKESTLVFSRSVTEKHLTPEYLKLSLNSGMLTQSTEKTLTKQISKFSFSHKTVQEFFCALYISCQNESDVKNIVLNKCKSLQSILDMSTVLVFISGMVNVEIITSISQEFLSVISEDKITSKYRLTTDEDCKPLKDIQDMYMSCMKENTSDKELKLFCQDLFFREDYKQEKYFTYLARLAVHNKNNMASININTLHRGRSLREIIDCCELHELFPINKISYYGKEENARLPVLLDKSAKCVAVTSSLGFPGSWSREMLETLQNNSLLQAIYIYNFEMSHDVLNEFLNYNINRKTMTEIKLWCLFCTKHWRSCAFSLDFSQHSDLRKLELGWIPEVSQLKVNSQVKHVKLHSINLGEMSLPPEMANIESVDLYNVNMSASTLRDLVKVVEKLSHKVTVTIDWSCKIEPETEFEHVKQYIRSSKNFRVTEDWWREFVFETNVES